MIYHSLLGACRLLLLLLAGWWALHVRGSATAANILHHLLHWLAMLLGDRSWLLVLAGGLLGRLLHHNLLWWGRIAGTWWRLRGVHHHLLRLLLLLWWQALLLLLHWGRALHVLHLRLRQPWLLLHCLRGRALHVLHLHLLLRVRHGCCLRWRVGVHHPGRGCTGVWASNSWGARQWLPLLHGGVAAAARLCRVPPAAAWPALSTWCTWSKRYRRA